MKRISPDKVLFAILFLTICVVVLSQIGLVFPKTRNVFTNVDSYEGTLLEGNEIPSGKVVLKLVNIEPSDEIEIVVNGEKTDLFNMEEKEIEITHTSVVEIYAHNIEGNGEVQIKNISENLKNTTGTKTVKIDKGYNMIGRFLSIN